MGVAGHLRGHPCRRRRRPRRRERSWQDHDRQAAQPDLRADRRPYPRQRRRPRGHRRRGVAPQPPPGSRTSPGSSSSAGKRCWGRQICRTSTTGRSSPARWNEPAATEVLAQLRGPRNPARHQLRGGVELSTGQWQKLALGRALMRRGPSSRSSTNQPRPWTPDGARPLRALRRRRHASAQRTARSPSSSRTASPRYAGRLIVVIEGGQIAEVGTTTS